MSKLFDTETSNLIEYSNELKPATGKVAIYARVANNSTGELKPQADMLVQKAEAIGDCNYTVYYEEGSGLKIGAELSEILSLIEKSEYTRLYIRDISRLTRDITLHNKIDKILCDANVEVITIY